MDYPQQAGSIKTTQSELVSAHIQFQEIGKRLDTCLGRLTTIANKLSDESGNINKEPVPEPSPRLPGLVSDFYRDVDGFRSLTSRIEQQLSKLESQI